MATVRTLRPFFDLVARCDRRPGDEFEATEARYEHIAGKLPGYVELAEADAEADAPDYSAMKVAELRACAPRGASRHRPRPPRHSSSRSWRARNVAAR